jgi:DNA-binding response OmpR family regulator
MCHIKRLREKLGPYARMIETIRGAGYRLRSDQVP